MKRLGSAVKFTHDGIDMHPAEYAALFSRLADEGKIPVDSYTRSGVVEALEEKFAQLLGKESAVFMPTGTPAIHITVRKQAKNGSRVIAQAESHLYNDSGDCAQTLSGLNLIALNPGKTGFTGFTMKINNTILRRKPEEIAGVFMTAAEKNVEGSK